MKDFIVLLIILAIVGLACYKIYIEKKKGVKCVGCSAGGCSTKKDTKKCSCNH